MKNIIVESAIENYLNHYGRITKKEVCKFFGVGREHKLLINQKFKIEWEKRNLPIHGGIKSCYEVEFPEILEVNKMLAEG